MIVTPLQNGARRQFSAASKRRAYCPDGSHYTHYGGVLSSQKRDQIRLGRVVCTAEGRVPSPVSSPRHCESPTRARTRDPRVFGRGLWGRTFLSRKVSPRHNREKGYRHVCACVSALFLATRRGGIEDVERRALRLYNGFVWMSGGPSSHIDFRLVGRTR